MQGAKSVLELLQSDFETLALVGTDHFLSSVLLKPGTERIEAEEKEITALSEFQTNDAVLAVARCKPNIPFTPQNHSFSLALDDIRDPGNLGTIIRTADWYGITQIFASAETAEFYNPKVISATMGSFTRTAIYYGDLEEVLSGSKQKIYGAFLKGNNVHDEDFSEGGLILIGNESRGIASRYEKFVTNKITIPRYGQAESLNAAIATAVICDNVRRIRSS